MENTAPASDPPSVQPTYPTTFPKDITPDDLNSIVHYKLLHWPVHAAGSTARDVLAFGQVEFEDAYTEDWRDDRLNAPFEAFPVVFMKTRGGKEIILSESFVVDEFLASRFHLLGDTEYETTMTKVFYSSSQMLHDRFAISCTWNQSAEATVKSIERFKSHILPTWIRTHERHLLANGNTGHYIGNKFTLADIRTANVILHLSYQPNGLGKELLDLIEKSEPIWKLKNLVEGCDGIREWRQSESFQALTVASETFFKNPHAYF